MPPQDLPTLPFDKHGYWFVTARIIPYPSKPVQWRILLNVNGERHNLHYIFHTVFAPFLNHCRRLPKQLCRTLRRNSAECRQLVPRRPNRRVDLDLHHPRVRFVMEIMPYIFVVLRWRFRPEGTGEGVLKVWNGLAFRNFISNSLPHPPQQTQKASSIKTGISQGGPCRRRTCRPRPWRARGP